jgi:hypothetical protein
MFMAKNEAKGHGRVGRIKSRSQTLNTQNRRWTERDTKTGQFTNVKSDLKPFKDIKIEK